MLDSIIRSWDATKMPLSDKDKVDGLIALSDQSQKKLESRRSLEWKLKLGLWAGLLLVVQHVMSLSDVERRALGSSVDLLFGLLCALDFLWTASMQRSHVIDQEFHLFYREAADRLLGVSNPEDRAYPKITELRSFNGYRKQWFWIVALWAPTAILTVGYFLMKAPPPRVCLS